MLRSTTVLVLGLIYAGALPTGVGASVTLPEETTIDLTMSPAPAGTVSGGQTVGATPSAAAGLGLVNPIQCMGKNDGYFEGDRVGGDIEGRWSFTGFSSCNYPMVGIQVDVDLTKDGIEKSSTQESSCANCQAVYANPRNFNCSSCEGVWRLVSQHTFTFPAGFVITDYDTGRCQLLDPLSIRCTVRSNKIRL